MSSTVLTRALRVVVYVRVSSLGQRDRQTIEVQKATIPRAIAAMGWPDAIEWYIDDGLSAADGHIEDRPALMRLLADAEAKRFDIVAVVDIDRLTRSDDMLERATILGRLQRARVTIYETMDRQAHDLSTPGGQRSAQDKALGAAVDNSHRTKRCIDGMEEAIAQGRKGHGVTNYGIAYNRYTREWSIDPIEGPIMEEMFARAEAGETCFAIAMDLNERGIATGRLRPNGKPRKNRAAFWTAAKVRQLLHNPIYRGEWVARRDRNVIVKVPAIVSDARWYRVQDMLAVNARAGLRQTRNIYLCEWISRCGVCARRIGIQTAFKSAIHNRPAQYRCLSQRDAHNSERHHACGLPNRNVEPADERVWARLFQALTSQREELAEMYAARNKSAKQQLAQWQKDIETAEGILARLVRTEKTTAELFRKGKLSAVAFEGELDAIARERAFAQEQLEAAQQARAVGSRSDRQQQLDLKALQRAAREATPAQRQAIVRALVPGHDDYVLTFQPEFIRIRGAVWENTSTEVLAMSSARRKDRQYFSRPPLVILELVA
jgi:Resolvase, N terminal domain/Recombinase